MKLLGSKSSHRFLPLPMESMPLFPMKSKTFKDNRGDQRDLHERRIEEKRSTGKPASPPTSVTQPNSVRQITAESQAQVESAMEPEAPTPSLSTIKKPPTSRTRKTDPIPEPAKAVPALTELRNEQDDLRVPIPHQPRKGNTSDMSKAKETPRQENAAKVRAAASGANRSAGAGSAKKPDLSATTESRHLAPGLMGSRSTRRSPDDGSKRR